MHIKEQKQGEVAQAAGVMLGRVDDLELVQELYLDPAVAVPSVLRTLATELVTGKRSAESVATALADIIKGAASGDLSPR